MRLPIIQKLRTEDIAKLGDIPKWLDPFISTLNGFITPVAQALTNRLTLRDNFFTKEVNLSFTSGTELALLPPPGARVIGVLPVYAGGKTLTGWKLAYLSTGNVGVTLTFAEGGTATCLLYLLLG
jgi:hypothetical protein